MSLRLRIVGTDGSTRSEVKGETEVELVHSITYAPGDRLRLEAGAPANVFVRFDTTLVPALLFLPSGLLDYPVPFGEARKAYAPGAFACERHYLGARLATPEELATRRNLALNPLDFPDNTTAFPHASATSQTRGETIFAARNVIDGLTATGGHGAWPYTSWGINRDPDATLTVAFGRPVLIDEVVLHIRADFPHDAWWRQATVSFSEGPDVIASMTKTGTGQRICFSARPTEWIRLHGLIKADDPSPFPALTSIACYGQG